MSNPCLEAVSEELDRVCVPYRVETTARHIHVHYGHEYEHMHVVAKTPSDWRAHLNERAQIKRDLLRLGYVSEDDTPAASPLVTLHDGRASCASYHIAEHFSKAHKDVLRAIDKIREECGPEFDRRNFTPIDYVDSKGRKYRAYSLTRDGFTLVVMGFTGRAATDWKVRYIGAFNALERELSALSNGEELLRIRSDLDAAVSLIGEMEQRVTALPAQRTRKAPFIRPSVLRKMRRRG